MAKKLNGTKGPKLYKAYWFRGRDPIMDEVKNAAQRTIGNQPLTRKKFREMELNGGPSASTLTSWCLKKTTMRPQYATVAASLGSLGLVMKIVKEE